MLLLPMPPLTLLPLLTSHQMNTARIWWDSAKKNLWFFCSWNQQSTCCYCRCHHWCCHYCCCCCGSIYCWDNTYTSSGSISRTQL
jgi:hypothetical protein